MIGLAELVPALIEGALTVPEDWGQGRTAYGGLLAAVAVHALRPQVPPERPARSLFFQFLGPICPGERIQVRAEILRAGKSLTVGQVTLSVKGEPSFVGLITYAASRPSSAQAPGDPAPSWPAPEELPAVPFASELTPKFTRAFDYRWVEGALPFSAASQGQFGGYFAYRDEPGAAETALLGMFDAWPPAALPLLDGPAPASSVSWSVHLFEQPEVRARQWWRYRAHTVAAGQGSATTRAQLFHPDGRLIACGEQLVALYG